MSSITQIGYVCDCCGLMVMVVVAWQGLSGCEFTTAEVLPPGWRKFPVQDSKLRAYHKCQRCALLNVPLPRVTP